MNRSKLRDPRHWDKMRAAGSVETIEAARARARTMAPTPGVGDPAYFGSAKSIPAGFTIAIDIEGLNEDAISFGRLSDIPESVTVPQAARALGVHPTTVRRRLARETYEGTQDGPTWSITDLKIREAVARHDLEG